MEHRMRGRHGAGQQGAAGRLSGAVDSVLKASLGAGLAVFGAYVLQRGRRHADLAARIDRLDALVSEMQRKNGEGG